MLGNLKNFERGEKKLLDIYPMVCPSGNYGVIVCDGELINERSCGKLWRGFICRFEVDV